ncbi:hypothetical protein V0R55_24795 [Pseudomonas soli]|uniref:Uncharacterized protein n=1 Tax=Pseudomonas soli TaxID=1306993 RepID=A0ABU7GWE7_9PSED|nr:hypothetical protein [Pseudomonas soli]MEE1883387.1 hypothetical protein [Pseudomonas soli]
MTTVPSLESCDMARRNRQEQLRLLEYRRLSARDQLAYWAGLKGLSLEAESPAKLEYLTPLLARAKSWRACVDDRPYEDRFALLTYIVYAPAYGGDLLLCHYHRGRWASSTIDGFIGGVTHWRLACPGEVERLAGPDELPVTRNA